ncbi:MAG TPA: ROK family protein [Nitrospira sp.]
MPKGNSREKKRRRVSKTRKAKSSTSRGGTINADEDSSQRRTLVVDVGGSGIKATLLNDLGKSVSERLRRESPASGMPGAVMDTIIALANELEPFDRVSVGFPGVVINGIVKQAPNLAKEWQGFNIAELLHARLKKPIRVANDADVQGFGAISGTGVELVVTLGTGVGTSLFVDGRLVPNLEIGRNKLRNSALQKVGKKRWNKRLIRFIQRLDEIFHFTKLYVGGGNSKEVDVALLPANVTIISNLNGLNGGIALWREEPPSLNESVATPEGNGHPLAA